MENFISLQQLQKAAPLLKKHIFTSIQLKALQKKIKRQTLSRNEKTYYYKFIRPKVRAMLAFSGTEEATARGEEWMIKERAGRARRILRRMQKKHRTARIMISGSFLFNKEFQDIDVFVFTKYQKEDYSRKKIHVNFLPQSALGSLFFGSLCQISLSNFTPETQKDFSVSLVGLLQKYELLVNEILNREDYQKNLRDFLLQMEYLSKRIVLNPLQLYILRKKFSNRRILLLLQRYLVENLVLNYPKKELALLKMYLKDYKILSKEYKNSANLQNYIQTYNEALKFAG
ncbi:MAG TPA: hypothetical protein VJG31_02890 [Candidatus Nanoarchaeia archaeon]|nr:hypothetical protein [Candidatus Nanoarchaeia archaeon]